MNVGEFVRTKDGLIRKIIEIDKYGIVHVDKDFISSEPEYHRSFIKEEIIKSSPQIIDLIEENDYIRIITDTDYRNVYSSYGKLVIYRGKELPIETFNNKFIGGIITHEQMETMQYRVEE